MAFVLSGPRIRHKWFNPGVQTVGGDFAEANTGVKLDSENPRAIRLLDVVGAIRNATLGADGFSTAQLWLQLSNIQTMAPGLSLYVGTWSFGGDGTADDVFSEHFDRGVSLAGTHWVAEFWALRLGVPGGTWTNLTPSLRVLYEIVPVDFESQLMMHELVDNIVDNEEDWWQL